MLDAGAAHAGSRSAAAAAAARPDCIGRWQGRFAAERLGGLTLDIAAACSPMTRPGSRRACSPLRASGRATVSTRWSTRKLGVALGISALDGGGASGGQMTLSRIEQGEETALEAIETLLGERIHHP